MWAEPAVAGIESVVGLMFLPTKLFATTIDSMVKAPQRVWDTVTGTRGSRGIG